MMDQLTNRETGPTYWVTSRETKIPYLQYWPQWESNLTNCLHFFLVFGLTQSQEKSLKFQTSQYTFAFHGLTCITIQCVLYYITCMCDCLIACVYAYACLLPWLIQFLRFIISHAILMQKLILAHFTRGGVCISLNRKLQNDEPKF